MAAGTRHMGTRDAKPFYPPLRDPKVLGVAAALAPWIMRAAWGIRGIEIGDDDLERLRRLRDTRGLIVANHPSLAEPPIVFQALRRAEVSAYFMASWENFAYYGRLATGLLQRLGVYSVMRGRRDRASLQTTLQLLERGDRVVIFPEGETYGMNDGLLPFQQGVVQIGFWALDELAKARVDAPLLVAPIAVKYVFTRPMNDAIEASLRRLETKLGLTPAREPPYDRLRRVATSVVAIWERECGIAPAPEETLGERIVRVREAMLARLAAELRVELPKGAGFPERVRILFNAYHDVVYGERPEEPDYLHAVREERSGSARPLVRAWERLHNFLAARDGYVRDLPSPERFVDILGRLESEVLGKPHVRGPRRALVRAGDPIDLRDHAAAYRASRRETISRLTREIEERVAAMVRELGRNTHPDPWLMGEAGA